MITYYVNKVCDDGYGICGSCIHVMSDKRNMDEAHEELLQYMRDAGIPEDAKELHHPFKNREHLDLRPEQFKVLDYIKKVSEDTWRRAQTWKKPYDIHSEILPQNS